MEKSSAAGGSANFVVLLAPSAAKLEWAARKQILRALYVLPISRNTRLKSHRNIMSTRLKSYYLEMVENESIPQLVPGVRCSNQ